MLGGCRKSSQEVEAEITGEGKKRNKWVKMQYLYKLLP